MVIAVRRRRLEARDPVARVNALHQPKVDEGLERAVDRGDTDGPTRPAEAVVNLLCAEAAVLPSEQLDHCAAGAATAIARIGEREEGVLCPRSRRRSHGPQCIVLLVIMRIVLVIGLSAMLAGCGGSRNARKGDVIAAFYPLAFAAERIGGADFAVENLTPPGAEPHDLELTPRDVGRIQEAQVVLYLGRGFQPAVSKAVEEVHGERVEVLAGLRLHDNDPHVWLDPVLFEQIGRTIGGALHRPAGNLVADLQQLDREYREDLRDCQRHEIVTSHEAFSYLAARYGLQQVAITGVTPESEPSPRELAHVIQVVRRTHATTIFFETLLSPRLAKTVAREVGARTAVLNPIEGLTPDEQKRGEDYLSLMRQNLAALRKALGCR